MFIELKEGRKSYGEGAVRVDALDGVDLSLDSGKINVILGPSGSGKSTLLNMMGGLDRLDSGSLMIDGHDLSKMDDRQLTQYRKDEVGFVFQFYNLIPDLTVRENIEVVSDISERPLAIDDVLSKLEIPELAHRFPHELSGGQQQRVAIGRAMVKNPKLLLCDEITGALDTKSSRTVLEFTEKMNREYGTTIIFITHNEAIAKMADVIIRIHDGRIKTILQNDAKQTAKDLEL